MSLCIAALCLAGLTAHAEGLRITEVVTDPQADHNESAGGNGVLWDTTPGTGSITTSDEYIEIVNLNAWSVDLTGYSITFDDTSPSTYVFGTTTTGTLRFSTGSSLSAFIAGGFVLLGNAPGAMNNIVTLELLAPDGALEDRWEILDGNATGLLNEAVARPLLGTGSLRAAITPLMDTPALNANSEAGTPVPESATGWLVGLTAAVWFLAKRRKALFGKNRTQRVSRLPESDQRVAHSGVSAFPARHGVLPESA